jgi:hypothetical protein
MDSGGDATDVMAVAPAPGLAGISLAVDEAAMIPALEEAWQQAIAPH